MNYQNLLYSYTRSGVRRILQRVWWFAPKC